MKKLNDEQIAKIESTRFAIQKLNKVQECGYNILCEECGLDQNDAWLYDYIFNCEECDDEYTQMVKEKVYGIDNRKLTEDEERLIDDVRLSQTGNGFEDEKRFQQLLTQLDAYADDKRFIDFIFEHVYASSTHSPEYLTHLKSRIYGSKK